MSLTPFGTPDDGPILETPMMVEARSRLVAAHQPRGQFVTFFGAAGVGKTTTTRWLAHGWDAHADAEAPGAFRARRVTMPPMARVTNPGKMALLLIRNVLLPPIKWNEARWTTETDLVDLIAHGCVTDDVQVLFVDEAGRLSSEALESLTLLIQHTGDDVGHPLTVVLVGMHALPTLIQSLPQIGTRVADTILFRPYDRDEAHALLSQVSPYFAALRPGIPEDREVLEFVVAKTRGLPRTMLQLVEKATAFAASHGRGLSRVMLEAALILSEEDYLRAAEDAANGYRYPKNRPAKGSQSRRGRRGDSKVEGDSADPDAGEGNEEWDDGTDDDRGAPPRAPAPRPLTPKGGAGANGFAGQGRVA